MSWISVICILGAVQGAFSILLFKKSKRKVHIGNSLFIAMLSLTLVARIGYEHGLFFNPQIALLSDALLFTYGPFLWLLFTLEEQKWSRKHLSHFLPAFAHTATIAFLVFIEKGTYLGLLNKGQLNSFFMFISVASSIHLGIYLFIIYRKVWKSSAMIRKTFLAMIVLCLTTWTFANVQALWAGSVVSNQFFQWIWVVLTLLAFFIAYQLFQGKLVFTNTTIKNASYLIIRSFEDFLKSGETFTNPQLRLPEVASQLKTNTLSLSNAINQHYGYGFPEYLNKLRVEKFEQLAKAECNAHLTHWALAQQAGFNSKSAFYRAYKRERQATPARVFRQIAAHS